MSSALKHVYCFQMGSDDCYKIGLTKHLPVKRMRQFKTGSPVKFTPCRDELTAHPQALETYIHNILADRRAENGEFFFVTRQEMDAAFDAAVASMKEFQHICDEAARLAGQKPNGVLAEPTEDMRAAYTELKAARRERFLLQQRIDVLESRIQVAIGGNSGMEGIATWEWSDSWRFDVSGFREGDPAAYEAFYEKYRCNSGGRRFVLERGNRKKAEDGVRR
jgi:hypothetical protein